MQPDLGGAEGAEMVVGFFPSKFLTGTHRRRSHRRHRRYRSRPRKTNPGITQKRRKREPITALPLLDPWPGPWFFGAPGQKMHATTGLSRTRAKEKIYGKSMTVR